MDRRRVAASAAGSVDAGDGSEQLVNELCRQMEDRDRQAKQREEALMRQLQEAQRKLAQMSVQQQQPSSSSSSSAPAAGRRQQQQQPSAQQLHEGDLEDCDICFGEHGVASVMYMPCKHLRLCPHCYEDRKIKWQRDLEEAKTENARRREENEGIERLNEGRKKEDRIPLLDMVDEPDYLCEHCKEKTRAGQMSEEPRRHTVWDQEWEPALEDPHSRRLRELLEPQGCSKVGVRSEGGDDAATMELAARAVCRTITSAEDVTRLCQEGADADLGLQLHLSSCRLTPMGLLSLVIDDVVNGRIDDDDDDDVVGEEITDVTLPPWPSHELQQAVLEALIAAGANPNGRPDEKGRPLHRTRLCANVTAVDVLLRAGAVTHGLHLAFWPCLPSPPSPQYETDLLNVYRRMLEHDPALVSETGGERQGTPIHNAGAAESVMSRDFICAYLDLLAQHGASLTARDAYGNTPLGTAVLAGAPCVVEWLCERLGKEEINNTKAEGNMISVLELAGCCLTGRRQKAKAEPEKLDKAKQVVRTLLRHGADIQLVRTTPALRYIRKLVQDIHKDMQKPSAPPQQQQKDSGAAMAAKMAEELIAEEAREKAKKAKRGGKIGGHQQQQQREQQQRPVSIELEAIEDDEAPDSSVATGAVETDADEQPPSTPSADPQPAAPSPSCDVSSAVPAPATSSVDREESDAEFVTVVRKKNKKARSHLQPDQQEPASTRQHAPVTHTQPLNISGLPFTSAARRPPAGRGLDTNMPTQTRAHRGPPPLVPMAAMPPSIGSSPLPPRPQQPPPPGLVRPLANTALAQRTSVSAGSSSQAADGQRGRCGGGESGVGTDSAAAAEHLVGQLRRQLSQKDQENDALIRQLQEAQWKLVQSSHHLQQQHQQASSDTTPAAADDGLKCDVCMADYKSTLLVPCRHICLCGGCAGVLMSGPPADRLCPRCRQPITDTQQVYL
ncbi:unnamed protein product [Vitrella brassicaformis CCMP3155]|uniref:RING-type domain-containing protein n=1 Tax=Vitrella brassicaformis (strain CCMP3155) TaxID=1169540 RepID=A0A0G4ER52_VITBC|nr:unnamed protein product [Vitrella brassicaformis CCMP3155]|eukprot:CEL99959.1 unnamed protein product [Vitrella brassicaformis CCMP3155]